MKTNTNLARSIASLAALILLLGLSASAGANWGRDGVYVVKCDEGMTPQRILDMQWFARPIELQLVGTCPGFEIRRDDVTVTARSNEACPGAIVEGQIAIEGANRTVLSCLEVTGPEGSVTMLGGQALLEDVDIIGNGGIGVELGAHSAMEMIGGSIKNQHEGVGMEASYAGLSDVEISNHGDGIRVENNSYFEMGGGSISNNAEDGVSARSNSVLDLEGVTIADNNGHGVALFSGANASFGEVTIRDNAGDGIYARKLVSINLVGGSVTNNANGVSLNQHSFAFVSRAWIENNRNSGVILRYDSGAMLWNGTNILGSQELADVVCVGDESSVQIHNGANIGSMECDHPDF